jgi:hypothetical protein
MRHVRPTRWQRLVARYPRLPNLLAIAGIVVSLGVCTALLLWIATMKITGLG